jgi:hypothetical protein
MREKVKVITYDVDQDGLGVYAISLVENPAIGVNWVALSQEKQTIKYAKVESGKRKMLYGALLIPDQLIYRVHPETKEEFYVKFPKETIRKIAHNYMLNSNQHNATYEHEFKIQDVSLVETWLIEGEYDKSKNFGFNLAEGTWFGGMFVDNEEIWNKVESGEVLGFSIEGEFNAIGEQFLSNGNNDMLKEIEELLQKYKLAEEEEIAKRYDEYMSIVNMNYSDLKAWSETECSKLASLDRSPIQRNLELLETNKDEWTNKHFEWAGKTIAFINRMRENTAGDSMIDKNGNECGSKKTISLKNWAYDPNK